MKVSCRTQPGVLHNFNKGACDWGWQGRVAYGCQNLVVVVDPGTVQVLQVLDRHKGYVVKVKWAKENYHHDLLNPYALRLASADYNGKIIVWDVAGASIKAEFADGSRPVADLEWLTSQDLSHDLLAALHPPYSLILWNADTGTKLWKKSYTEVLQGFAFDPFVASNLAFLGQDCIVFVEDFSINKVPSSNGKKYFISSPSTQGGSPSSGNSGDTKAVEKKSRTNLTRKMSSILVGEGGKSRLVEDEGSGLNECLQLTYHRACRNHLILLYPREISILDLDINQTVGVIPMERTGSPFTQIIPLQQRDVLMCLHENGMISVRIRRRSNQLATPAQQDQLSITPSQEELPAYTQLDMSYDLRCQSDALRVTKHNRMFGAACCPTSEAHVALIMSDGRILFWELTTVDYVNNAVSQIPASPLYTPGPIMKFPGKDFDLQGVKLPLGSDAAFPKQALMDMIGHTQSFVMESQTSQPRHGVMLKFILNGLLCGVSAPPFVIRMCPPLTTKNWNIYQPLLALGNGNGVIQVYNLSNGELHRELNIHSCTIRGIEWVSLHSFLSHACPSPGPNNTVKNELFLTDILTGKTTPYRPNREEEPPIDMIRISYLKQYFVVMFKDKPFELWDLRTGTLIKQMPRNFPHVTALEWLPSNSAKNLKRRPTQDRGQDGGQGTSDLTSSSSAPLEFPTRSDSIKASQSNSPVKEHFVFTDADGQLYHFMVEGNIIKEGSRVPPDGGMGSISAIAWKGEQIVMGDIDGNLNLWDLKARVTRTLPTHRGWVKKLRFAPGRGNMKLLVLYNDGADVWDAKEVEHVSSIKSPKEISKVTDLDWAASDKPVLACADGTVRVLDHLFKEASSAVSEYTLSEPVFCPHLLAPKAALTMKCLLQGQPWNQNYQLVLEETDENRDVHTAVMEQLSILDRDLQKYLPHCHLGTAQRCLLTARLFGDESEVTFWTVALHYLRMEKAEPMSKNMTRSASNASSGDLFIPTPQRETHDLVQFDDPEGKPSVISWAFLRDRPLETCFDILCDNHTFQKYQLDRIALHDSKRATYEHTKQCAENLMMLGQADRAVQLLLETDADNDGYYIDCLRACLVASIRSSGASQSTIKLVATNLIANGKLSEGVQLLCLIDKGMDACRYLQTYGHWYKAAWLAKATLDFTECAEVLKRWTDHLSSTQVNQKSKAVLVMLSLGQFIRAVEMLYSMRQFDRAALFVQSCLEFGLIEKNEETLPLIEAVFLEYARTLISLGMKTAAEHYCTQAGEKGQLFLKEMENMYTG